MTIRFAARAIRDLSRIGAYVAQHDPVAAVRIGNALERTIQRLDTFPLSGRLQDISGAVRKLVVPVYGYLVYYRIDDEGILVLTIRHGARKRIFDDR